MKTRVCLKYFVNECRMAVSAGTKTFENLKKRNHSSDFNETCPVCASHLTLLIY